ncbi:transporter substrate-binding domain-containing protein [Maridesulfovibrio sp.]|uniref:substrate-binding periplasmic protein n=1 Tax=Maridesulfovibrio sp. TaxID=2795000 RepID=UPI0029F46FB5|nr:transporter substrate-binding domain-containing protein [Maridesulfovibrio sp.]
MLRFIFSAVILLVLAPSLVQAEKLLFVTLNSPPQSYIEDGKPTGFLIELVELAAKRAGYETEVRILPWKRALIMVKHGNADAVFNAGYNEERNKYMRYPETVLITEKVVAVRRSGSRVYFSSKFEGADKFVGGTGRGFYYGRAVDTAIKQGKFKRIEDVPNIDLNIKKLLLGRIDFFFADYYPAISYLNEHNLLGKLEAVINPLNGLPLVYSQSDTYLAFSRKKSPVPFIKVNTELKKMKQDGTYLKIISKYIPVHEGF